ITLSDLERQARIIAVNRDGLQGLSALSNPSFIVSMMDFLINQLLVIQEMRKLGATTQGLGEEDAVAELRKFRAHFSDETSYRSFLAGADLKEETIKEIVLRNMRVERFLDRKARQGVEIPVEDAEAFFNGNRSIFPQKTFAEAEAGVKEVMFRQRAEKFAKDYLQDLRSRYEVRIVAMPQ
ncbi:MAG: hypothetical protein WC889_13660, partial [Myxococcota bacterium]